MPRKNNDQMPTLPPYDPLKVGNAIASSSQYHDRALLSASRARYHPNERVKGDPKCTVFVGNLNRETDEKELYNAFSRYGHIKRLRLVRDFVTGLSMRYAFVEFTSRRYANKAYAEGHHLILNGYQIFVDQEFERLLQNWVPRRLGGGFGGRKSSGQLRFGCRENPHYIKIHTKSSSLRKST
ncbi:RRM 1 domain containing protein [Trichuris trichiura]|uniref:U11/U12 small nuclear ribonucleoprotein 35 kDa protein n=1 Tax=Trichuris trichiura TaxID=36087 RepID=A0A077Z780_TRITR|nr:RRM 1 domain containing protein [Trichuris trichiura]